MPDGDQPILCAVNNVGMAINVADPFVRSQMIAQNIADRENGKEAFDDLLKIVVRRVQDQVPWFVFGGHFCREPASKTPAVHYYVMFVVLLCQDVVYKLHVIKHLLFTTLTSALTKAPVIYKDHIIVISIKIFCIPGPPLYTSCVTMEIKNKAERFFAVEMKPVNANTRFDIKK